MLSYQQLVIASEQPNKQIKLEDIEHDNLESEKNVEVLKTEQTQSASLKQSSSSDTNSEEKGESKESSQTEERYAPLPSGYEGHGVDIQYVTPSSPAALIDYGDAKSMYMHAQNFQPNQFFKTFL